MFFVSVKNKFSFTSPAFWKVYIKKKNKKYIFLSYLCHCFPLNHWINFEQLKLTMVGFFFFFCFYSCPVFIRTLPIKNICLILVCSLKKAMAPHSSTPAWKIPWTEKRGRLQSVGSLRVGHDWATSLSLFTFMHWRRKWQPTPVFLPGESQGRGSLVGCRLWGRIESDMGEVT